MSTQKKYEFTGETIRGYGPTLHRIRAVRDFSDVKAGELGGFIEKESNLSHEGDCWVADEAKVLDNARVFVNAKVSGHARVFDNAVVCDDAEVCGHAKVSRDAQISGSANIWHVAEVSDSAIVEGRAIVQHSARITGSSHIKDNAVIQGCAWIHNETVNFNATLAPAAIIINPAARAPGNYKKFHADSCYY